MKKRVYKCSSDFFSRDNFYELIKKLEAKKISDLICYSQEDKTLIIYRDIGEDILVLDTELVLYGNSKGIEKIGKEIGNVIEREKNREAEKFY